MPEPANITVTSNGTIQDSSGKALTGEELEALPASFKETLLKIKNLNKKQLAFLKKGAKAKEPAAEKKAPEKKPAVKKSE